MGNCYIEICLKDAFRDTKMRGVNMKQIVDEAIVVKNHLNDNFDKWLESEC